MPRLTQLAAARCLRMCEDVTSMLTNLTYLCLDEIAYLSHDGVSTIVHNNSNLEVLSLSECESVDDIGKSYFPFIEL